MDPRMINFTPSSYQNFNYNYDYLPPFSAEYLDDNNRPFVQQSYWSSSGVVNDTNTWTPNSNSFAFAEAVPRRRISMPPLLEEGEPSTSSGPAHGGGNSNTTKKAIRWSIEEHTLFLIGLKKCNKKGDWKSISRNYVTTRSATQVASHAQKFFKRQQSRDSKESQPVTGEFKKKRTSIHDLKVEDVADDDIEIARLKKAIEEQQLLRRAESMNKDIPLNFHQ